MKHIAGFALMFSVMFASHPGFAQYEESEDYGTHFYGGLSIGASFNDSYFIEAENQSNLTFFSNDIELDSPSVLFGGNLGVDFGYIRLEGDLSYRSFDAGATTLVNGNGTFTNTQKGSVSLLNFMFSAYLLLGPGIDLTDDTFANIFVGTGLGFANVSVSNFATNNASQNATVDESTSSGTFQFSLGVDFIINNMYDRGRPGAITFQYRFLGTIGDLTLTDSAGNEILADGLTAHEFSVGIRYYFN